MCEVLLDPGGAALVAGTTASFARSNQLRNRNSQLAKHGFSSADAHPDAANFEQANAEPMSRRRLLVVRRS